MVGDAFWIAALCDAYDLLRQLKLLLLHHLEVADDVDGCVRSYEGELVQFLILEELVFNLDDSLAALSLAVEVDSNGDLVLDALEVEQIESPVYVFGRNVVQYGTVLQCAYY